MYVADYFADTLTVIASASNSVVSSVAVGKEPLDVVVNPVTGELYVPLDDGTIAVGERLRESCRDVNPTVGGEDRCRSGGDDWDSNPRLRNASAPKEQDAVARWLAFSPSLRITPSIVGTHLDMVALEP